MRKRKIRKIGNSYYVKLEQIDIKDWEVNEGEEVEVKPLKNNHNNGGHKHDDGKHDTNSSASD